MYQHLLASQCAPRYSDTLASTCTRVPDSMAEVRFQTLESSSTIIRALPPLSNQGAAMSSFLVFTNLRVDLTEDELNAILAETGPSDRTSARLVREATSSLAMIEVPWETSVAVAVARNINGSTFRGQKLQVHATAMF